MKRLALFTLILVGMISCMAQPPKTFDQDVTIKGKLVIKGDTIRGQRLVLETSEVVINDTALINYILEHGNKDPHITDSTLSIIEKSILGNQIQIDLSPYYNGQMTYNWFDISNIYNKDVSFSIVPNQMTFGANYYNYDKSNAANSSLAISNDHSDGYFEYLYTDTSSTNYITLYMSPSHAIWSISKNNYESGIEVHSDTSNYVYWTAYLGGNYLFRQDTISIQFLSFKDDTILLGDTIGVKISNIHSDEWDDNNVITKGYADANYLTGGYVEGSLTDDLPTHSEIQIATGYGVNQPPTGTRFIIYDNDGTPTTEYYDLIYDGSCWVWLNNPAGATTLCPIT